MNEPATPKKNNKATFALIGCGAMLFLGVPCLGILSAIAIPAYLRAVRKAKSSEADGLVTMIAEGAKARWAATCQFPPELKPTGSISEISGGSKYTPDAVDAEFTNQVGVAFDEPLYFIYTTRLDEVSDTGASYVITAKADFQVDLSHSYHTVEQRVVGLRGPDGCTAEVTPAVTLHSFE